LSVAHGIIKAHHGEITVESEPGKGSTFTVYLPILKQRVEEKPELVDEIPTGKENVLLVDDEAPIAQMGRQILERLGYTVTVTTSSAEALGLFKSKPDDFDLVITDMNMPNMAGDRLSKELLALRPNVPIIICTGYSKRVSKENASEIGVRGFIMKPYVKSQLAKTVRTVLDQT
jgi:CheY-like chemotaxis protein